MCAAHRSAQQTPAKPESEGLHPALYMLRKPDFMGLLSIFIFGGFWLHLVTLFSRLRQFTSFGKSWETKTINPSKNVKQLTAIRGGVYLRHDETEKVAFYYKNYVCKLPAADLFCAENSTEREEK